MNHRIAQSIAVALALVAGAGPAVAQKVPTTMTVGQRISKVAFQRDMRKLWEDHITWTRLYIVSALADLPDKAATATRLLQNQTDIGGAIKPFYGDAAGDQLTGLLKDHILIATDLIGAVQTGDSVRSAQASERWNANADAIAGFLSAANPASWSAGDMKTMMHDHLSATTAEVVARLKKDWEGDIRAYDKVHLQILGMADMLSGGIERQFPAKFR